MHLLAASHSHGCWAISGIYWVATAPSSANWARLHQLCNNVLICPVQQLSSCSTVNWDVSASGRGKNKNLQSHCLWVTAQAHSYARLEVKSLQARVIFSPCTYIATSSPTTCRMLCLHPSAPGCTFCQVSPFSKHSTLSLSLGQAQELTFISFLSLGHPKYLSMTAQGTKAFSNLDHSQL